MISRVVAVILFRWYIVSMSKLVLVLCFLGGWILSTAQTSNQRTPTPAPVLPSATASPTMPSPHPGDVDTIDHILVAIYDVISGPAGAPRDWDRFRSLFYPGARLIPSNRNDKGIVAARVLSPEDYVSRGKDAFANQAFFETSIGNRIEVWDHLAHVWSTYESRHAQGEKPFARGINSFQLLNDGSRWWILSVYWEAEDKDHPLPERYLKSATSN